MRHGVRPPTKAVPLPKSTVRDAWPQWSVPPGWLTPHGAQAIGRLAEWDGSELRRDGLLPAEGCPAAGSVTVIADSDQRTIATADAWISGALPGCGIASEHRKQDESDPAFSPIKSGLVAFDPAKAQAAVIDAAGPGGIAAVEAAQRPLLERVDAILCGDSRTGCGVSARASGIDAPADGKPGLTGALDLASTAGQILVLEYGEGKPLAEVGWGRASVDDIAALSAFHALEFRLLARPRYNALANFAGLAPLVKQGLSGKAKVTLIVGHDTNVANLGGLLDAHWQVPGLAEDDPAPGGALVLTALHDKAGHRFVRIAYRSQTLDQIRAAGPLGQQDPYRTVIVPGACTATGDGTVCPLAVFEKLAGL